MKIRFELYYLLAISLLIGVFSSCLSDSQKDKDYAIFGGEIVNPNTNYVILTKDYKHSDTLYLNDSNRFYFKISNVSEGIYSFTHNPETQIFLLEKGDSILVRLNTLEFDESLVFTGKGARKNNFMVEMFLQNEIERKQLKSSAFKSSPYSFMKTQDSLLAIRKNREQTYLAKYDLSDLAIKVTKSSYLYDFYARYEMYFYWHYGMSPNDSFTDVPKSFFDFRSEVNFNDDDLKRSYAYNRFLNHHVINLTYTNYINNKKYPQNQSQLLVQELNIVDSLVTHPYIKNNLLKGFTAKFLLENNGANGVKVVLDAFLKYCTNARFNQEISRLSKYSILLQPGNSIPDQLLIPLAESDPVAMSALFAKPITVIYFWCLESKSHYLEAHKKATQLRSKYPDIDLIAINTDVNQSDSWKQAVKTNHFDQTFEYAFASPKVAAEELIIHYRNKVILVDQEGKIIHSNLDLFAANFEHKLKDYLQKTESKDVDSQK